MTRLLAPATLLALGTGCFGSMSVWPDEAPADPCDPASYDGSPIKLLVDTPDRTRRALVWMPSTPGPWDIVVDLHEFRSEPIRQQHYTGWLPFAGEAGVILVAPDGKSATWNVGPCCGRAQEKDAKDVVFLDGVVAALEANSCTTGRVLATGIGNGAMMAQHWACHSEVPDGVVSVGGGLQVDDCPVDRPVPVLHYHGADDDFIPPGGGQGRVPTTRRGGHRPIAHAQTVWTARNGGTEATTTDDAGLICHAFDGEAPTTFCTVEGAGDTWPGAANAPDVGTGPLKDATRGAWAWMQAAWKAEAAAAE